MTSLYGQSLTINIFLLDVNFDKSSIGLHFSPIYYIVKKISEDPKSIAM